MTPNQPFLPESRHSDHFAIGGLNKRRPTSLLVAWFLLFAAYLLPIISAADVPVNPTNWVGMIGSAGSGDTIVMEAGTYAHSSAITVTWKKLSFVTASGSNDVVIQRTTADQRVFLLRAKAEVSFTGIEFDGKGGSTSCLAVVASSLSLHNVSIHDCLSTSSDGGAISVDSTSYLLAVSSTFTSNAAPASGAISIDLGIADLTNCTFTNNTAFFYGGGAITLSDNAKLTDCTFTNNTANQWGGAISFYSDLNADLTHCTFTNNTAAYGGGAISMGGNAKLTDCTFTNNTAYFYSGGAIFIGNGNADLTHCTFTDNTATHGGGAISISLSSNAKLIDCTFTNNSAFPFFGGGAIFIDSTGNADLTDCTFTNNTAASGGAVYTIGLVEISNTVISQCNATTVGGGVYVGDGTAAFTNCSLLNNWAQQSGGGAYFGGGQSSWSSVTFEANHALVNGSNCFVSPPGIFTCSSCVGSDCLDPIK